MSQPIELFTDQKFESKHDDDKLKTTWFLRSMTGFEFLKATSQGEIDHEYVINTCLTNWTDFFDIEGTQIPFSKENISRISPIILQDISFQIQSLSVVTEKERKNSE